MRNAIQKGFELNKNKSFRWSIYRKQCYIILPGITIGKGALIGAGPVITKDVPHNKIIVQNNIITGYVNETGPHND